MRKLYCFIGIMLMLILSGCAGMNSSFTCKAPDGQYCQPIHKMNAMVDDEQSPTVGRLQKTKLTKSNKRFQPSPYRSASSLVPKRLPEQTLRIWIESFIDTQGHLHEAHWVNTIIKPAEWQIAVPNKIAAHK